MSLSRTTRAWILTTALALGALVAPIAEASLVAKSYQFKPGVVLEMGVESSEGVRLDSVQFQMPKSVQGKIIRTGGLVQADIAISNLSENGKRVGIALALFDEEGRVVGVASGGTRLTGIKSQRQRSFRLVFDHVNGSAHTAKTFQISVEVKD